MIMGFEICACLDRVATVSEEEQNVYKPFVAVE